MDSFHDKLQAAQQTSDSLLCVGLDPDPDRLPEPLRNDDPAGAVLAFNIDIIDATRTSACAYKLNLAFYESMGSAGWKVLEQTLIRIPPKHIVIADGKRGDIGNSARMYARSVFSTLGFDACTVSPYMGFDSVSPFLEYEGTAAFVLCITSNPGAADFQQQPCHDRPLYEIVAEQAEQWSAGTPGIAGLVVGATHPVEMSHLRSRHPLMPFLIPGVGSQGGDIRKVIRGAGTKATLINVSREILYASTGSDFQDAAAQSAAAYKDAMNGVKRDT